MNDAARLDIFCDALWLEEGLAQNTLNSYRRDLSKVAEWLKRRNLDLLQASHTDLLEFLAEHSPRMRATSMSRLLSSLRRFYQYAVRQGTLAVDPSLQIERPKLPRGLPKSLSEADV